MQFGYLLGRPMDHWKSLVLSTCGVVGLWETYPDYAIFIVKFLIMVTSTASTALYMCLSKAASEVLSKGSKVSNVLTVSAVVLHFGL